jgi:hypothetical protein
MSLNFTVSDEKDKTSLTTATTEAEKFVADAHHLTSLTLHNRAQCYKTFYGRNL